MNVVRLMIEDLEREQEKRREQRSAAIAKVARLTREIEQAESLIELAKLYERPVAPDGVDDAAEDAAQLIRRIS